MFEQYDLIFHSVSYARHQLILTYVLFCYRIGQYDAIAITPKSIRTCMHAGVSERSQFGFIVKSN